MKYSRFRAYPKDKKERIHQAFWADYFTLFPDPGSNDEVNTMRRQFQERGSVVLPRSTGSFDRKKNRTQPDYGTFRANHPTIR